MRVRLVCLMLMVGVLFGSTTSFPRPQSRKLTEKEAKKVMEHGDKLVKRGKSIEAGGYYLRVVQDYADNGEAWLKLARVYREVEELQNALNAYENAAKMLSGPSKEEAAEGVDSIRTLLQQSERAVALPGPGVTAANCDLTIESFDTQTRKGEYGEEFVQLLLKVKNGSDRRINAWRLTIDIADVFGEQLSTIKVTEGSTGLARGGVGVSTFEAKNNPFIDDEPYDRLIPYKAENLRITIKECQVSDAR